jgi:DNA-binding PucR family transcriptional regulator
MVLELSGTRSEAGPAFSAETAAVVQAVASFIAHVAQPDRSMQPVLEEFQAIGATAAREERIAETLLAWLQLGENAAEVAQRIHVHPQTVRYRLRQITELFGDQLCDPHSRFELQLALRIRHLTASDS